MRFAVAALGCFIATLAPARAGDSQANLDALLRRVRSAAGEPYRYHVRGTARESAAPGVRIETDAEGSRRRVRRCAGELCSGTYEDGAALWLTDLNDTAVPGEPLDPRRVSLRAIENYAFADPDFAKRGGRVDALPPLVASDGRSLLRVAVTAPQGATLEALIDPATGLVAGARGRGIAVDYTDQSEIGSGVTVPFEIAAGDNVERFEERAIDPEALSAPRGLVPRFASPSASLPFAGGEGHDADPIVECVVAGARVPCLLDTGNSGMAISLELIERLGLEPLTDSFRIQGLGAYETGVVRVPELRVGTASYPPAYYAVLHDMHAYGYDIVLGTDAFAHARITLDYPAHRVAIEPEAAQAAAGGVPIEFEGFLPVVPVELGATAARLTIDTGDESAVNLSREFYRLHPQIFTPNASSEVAGIGGQGEELLGTIARVDLGGFALLKQPIGTTNRSLPTAQGHLGSGALRHFVVTFDYAHHNLSLRPRDGDPAVVSSSAAPR
jgi:hypothetical protein